MSYFSGIAIFLLALFPVLVPAVISGFHAIASARRNIARRQTIARSPRLGISKILNRDIAIPVEA